MAYAYSTLLLITVLACRLASIDVPNLSDLAIGFAFLSAIVLTLAVYWHERGKTDLRDAALTIPWAFLLAVTLSPLVVAIAKLGMHLQDAHLARIDGLFGISVPQITSWSSHHWLGTLVNRSYPLLSPLLTLSVFLPALGGKAKNAQQFVMANLIGFFVGLSLFALVPAIGPWYGYGFAGTPHQIECQSALLLFRGAGHSASQLDAIICFPSFHVMWAMFCVVALWGFRLLRIPVALFSGAIIVSTVTTGWHYFIDVLGGIVVACLSIAIAKACTETTKVGYQELEAGSRQ
jgi:hypothetical protein